MERHKNLAPLSREHHRFLVLSQLLKASAPNYKGLPTTSAGKMAYLNEVFEHTLLPHIWREENRLFPILRTHGPELQALCDELANEHLDLIALIRAAERSRNIEAALDQIGVKLALHVRKEERELFQLAQEKVPEEVLRELRLGKVPG